MKIEDIFTMEQKSLEEINEILRKYNTLESKRLRDLQRTIWFMSGELLEEAEEYFEAKYRNYSEGD